MGGRSRRQAEAVTVMAVTLTKGGPCTSEIRDTERSGRFDRKRAPRSLTLLSALCQLRNSQRVGMPSHCCLLQ
ncbi:uncharacterized protein M421DRAFT_426082 [Didymella exigua CBS 183.55]|uniref:Uncharacterized protein n=1 Tax=Didymella exigua CBS 183.55 TaxID=1150837 RepID=A0A6A5R6B2_9PLEO|nr:uncharacterized protein M421DRAFT_426082 [Didymella exigua CBS 183.55]KAF1923113.1 hypothetical protein M421DRAFT_426082 [Didymella exigua CBS 183.55]